MFRALLTFCGIILLHVGQLTQAGLAITELMLDVDSTSGEWIEIYNNGSTAEDLSSLEIVFSNGAESQKVFLPEVQSGTATALAPNSFMILFNPTGIGGIGSVGSGSNPAANFLLDWPDTPAGTLFVQALPEFLPGIPPFELFHGASNIHISLSTDNASDVVNIDTATWPSTDPDQSLFVAPHLINQNHLASSWSASAYPNSAGYQGFESKAGTPGAFLSLSSVPEPSALLTFACLTCASCLRRRKSKVDLSSC
ncbi:lamin tail domain-containing protein [Stieleria sp. JC731]|uniref:lamin tail domain-containing protein n=1 Tax=Pirellulaceae TaxID=2691357 RepID=UPI001E4D0133|nr:lamin tail domain-containing protein [Stieleria sp. JC731]MCC9601431.1 lamin tail domain-containing protein [Stieleria sp. JC731]